MAHIVFTANIQRHLHCPPAEVSGKTLRNVLEALFVGNPGARDYVLDNQGAVRQHIAIFVNGESIRDRQQLSDPVTDDAEVYIIQSLSGG